MPLFKAVGPVKKTGLKTNGKAQVSHALKIWAGNTLRRVADYPSQQPTEYIRTGTLGRNWKMKVSDDEATVTNATEYAQWVQGDNQTRVMSSKGWQTIETIAKDEERKLVTELKDALLD